MRLVSREPGSDPTLVPSDGIGLRLAAADRLEFVDVRDAEAVVWCVPFREHGAPRAVLVVAPGAVRVFLDGERPPAVAVLDEGSEILVGARRLRFSERGALAVVAFPAGAAPARCGVCTASVEPGDAVVICCRTPHHAGARAGSEGATRDCFGYRGGRCAVCGRGDEDDEEGAACST